MATIHSGDTFVFTNLKNGTLMKTRVLMILGLAATTLWTSCDPKEENDDDDDEDNHTIGITVPSTYEFTRDGASSVSYSGQTDRLNQLAEMKTYLATASSGTAISADVLNAMFANEGDNGGGNFSFTSTKQLANKTFELDTAWYYALFAAAADLSDSAAAGVQAAAGKGGLITRGSKGSDILVDENGHEFVQLIEKGIMGSTFYYQIYNSYLTDAKIGPAVDNATLEDGKNYTAKEHHFDEAFGYFGAPIDFDSDHDGTGASYWAKYSNSSDDLTGSNDAIMDAFKLGRASIVANSEDSLNMAVTTLYAELEKVAAATAIHYLNDALNATDDGDRLHVLSEAYAFIRALKFSPVKSLTNAQITELLDVQIGENFWAVTASGLNNAIATLAQTYGYEAIADEL